MPNLKIDMSRFDELKAMSLEKLIDFRDWECQKHDRPSGLSDDMFKVEKKYIAYLEEVNKPEPRGSINPHLASEDVPF